MTLRCDWCGGSMLRTGDRDRTTRKDEPPHCLSCGRTNTPPVTLESLGLDGHHNLPRRQPHVEGYRKDA